MTSVPSCCQLYDPNSHPTPQEQSTAARSLAGEKPPSSVWLNRSGFDFPDPQPGRLRRDRTREWWKAELDSQLQWWFWVMASGPASVSEDQRLANLERHRQKVKDGLGWRVEGR
jgi:hypothetical protein